MKIAQVPLFFIAETLESGLGVGDLGAQILLAPAKEATMLAIDGKFLLSFSSSMATSVQKQINNWA